MTAPLYAVGKYVSVRAKVIEARGGELGYLVELWSKTDQYHAWVRSDLITGPAPTPLVEDVPQGLGAVVADEHGGLFIRTDHDAHTHEPWRAANSENTYRWDQIGAVDVLSDGWEERG